MNVSSQTVPTTGCPSLRPSKKSYCAHHCREEPEKEPVEDRKLSTRAEEEEETKSRRSDGREKPEHQLRTTLEPEER